MNFFTFEEYKKFDSVIDDIIYHTLFELLYFCGLRIGEANALTFKDINFNNNTITINKTLTTKIKGEKWTISTPKTKGSNRVLPITKQLSQDLKTLYNKYSKFHAFNNNWFVFGGIRPIPENTITNKKNKFCELAKVKKIRIHDFRHSCASLLINNGANITIVSKFLGHSKISITLDTYTHMYSNKLNEIVDILDNLE